MWQVVPLPVPYILTPPFSTMSLIHLVGFVLSFCFTFTVVLAEHNVTVDDTSSLITYKGSWSSVDSPLDYNGSHSYSQDPTATATLQFTGPHFHPPAFPFLDHCPP